jgi:hypothetical protein
MPVACKGAELIGGIDADFKVFFTFFNTSLQHAQLHYRLLKQAVTAC